MQLGRQPKELSEQPMNGRRERRAAQRHELVMRLMAAAGGEERLGGHDARPCRRVVVLHLMIVGGHDKTEKRVRCRGSDPFYRSYRARYCSSVKVAASLLQPHRPVGPMVPVS